MDITKDTIIGDVVAKDYRAASVFDKVGIDFCCQGNRSIAEACEEINIDADKIIKDVNEAMTQRNQGGIDYRAWPLDLLADYIEKKHHRYVTQMIQEIPPYLEKIVRVHGDSHPELAEVEKQFKISMGELSKHMKKEEILYFPLVRKMVNAKNTNTPMTPTMNSAKELIATMLQEHDHEGERFREISRLTNSYTLPEDGCNTYKITLEMLKEFQEDLHLHIHLENNILFPKSLEIEEELVTA